MAFKMKGINQVLSLHETSNHLDRVIKEVDMPDPRVHGYIDQNKTIFINKALGRKEKSLTINHENVHKRQIMEGRLKFDDNKYEWKGKGSNKTITYPMSSIDTRRRDLPWEKEKSKEQAQQRKFACHTTHIKTCLKQKDKSSL